MLILCCNAGSSSLKIAGFGENCEELFRGAAEQIGTPDSRVRWIAQSGSITNQPHPIEDYRGALERLLEGLPRPTALGHRVVHGGNLFQGPVRLDNDVCSKLAGLSPLAPLHLPPALRVIEECRTRFPDVPQIACFDTSIHRTIPESACRYPLPGWVWDAGIRKYGFHGLSYESALEQVPELSQGRTIIAHLGQGCSISAFRDGVCLETSMGFTPLAGLVMGTRPGDLDPGVLLHLLRTSGKSLDEIDQMLNRESGLRGISGSTGDMKQLIDRGRAGGMSPLILPDDTSGQEGPHALMALEIFCHRLRFWIGGLIGILGQVEHLVFTGGIGENAPLIREKALQTFSELGIRLDPARNQANLPLIHSQDSHCSIHVVKTNEERTIARQVLSSILAAGQF